MVPIGAMAAEQGRAPSRLVPARGLLFYLEFDGLAAHARAWDATAAGAILRQRSTGAMIADVSRQVLDRLLNLVPGRALTGDDLVALQEHMARHGFALACHDEAGRTSTVVILNHGGEVRDRIERLLRFATSMGVVVPNFPAPAQVRGRKLHCIGLAKPDAEVVAAERLANLSDG